MVGHDQSAPPCYQWPYDLFTVISGCNLKQDRFIIHFHHSTGLNIYLREKVGRF